MPRSEVNVSCCENCKHWDRRNKLNHEGTIAGCAKLKEKVRVGPRSASTGWFATTADFGCNLFEERQ